jgi:porphobilinogen deaminase
LERALVEALHGDCHSPIGALARKEGTGFRLKAMVAGRGGEPPVVREEGHGVEAQEVLAKVFGALVAKGAQGMLGRGR